jgi:hypothetical protein
MDFPHILAKHLFGFLWNSVYKISFFLMQT